MSWTERITLVAMMAMFGLLLGLIVKPAKPNTADCPRLFSLATHERDLLLVITARPECAAALTRPMLDSLGLAVAE